MCVWLFAYHTARNGMCWQQMAVDRCRFQRRIQQTSKVISPVLTKEHREKIFCHQWKCDSVLNET